MYFRKRKTVNQSVNSRHGYPAKGLLAARSDGGDLYLSVRADNQVARDFYQRRGMRVIGTVAWANGSILGLVYIKECLIMQPGVSLA